MRMERRSGSTLRLGQALPSFVCMRLLWTLAHLVLALAFVSTTTAQAQLATGVVMAAAPQQRHVHQAAPVAAGRVVHDHGHPVGDHQAHKRDTCQAACCFTAGQLPAHTPAAGTTAFFCAVRYVVDAQPNSGRAFAPDPGVPKPLA